jgi:hypothetical protein
MQNVATYNGRKALLLLELNRGIKNYYDRIMERKINPYAFNSMTKNVHGYAVTIKIGMIENKSQILFKGVVVENSETETKIHFRIYC